jgi:hypothetical protein
MVTCFVWAVVAQRTFRFWGNAFVIAVITLPWKRLLRTRYNILGCTYEWYVCGLPLPWCCRYNVVVRSEVLACGISACVDMFLKVRLERGGGEEDTVSGWTEGERVGWLQECVLTRISNMGLYISVHVSFNCRPFFIKSYIYITYLKSWVWVPSFLCVIQGGSNMTGTDFF